MLKKILLSLLIILLTGCQHLNMISSQPWNKSEQSADQFLIQGKFGVKTSHQTSSAFYTWNQQKTDYTIKLSGILGIGSTQINGTKQQVTLSNSQLGTITASTAEELLQQTTGWIAPISHLKYWVQAQTQTQTAKIKYDSLQRPVLIEEQNWNVHLEYNKQNTKPCRLIMYPINQEQSNDRITMTIQDR